MVKRRTVRLICLVIGTLALTILLSSHADAFTKILGTILSIILIGFGFAITSKWAEYVIGEPEEDKSLRQKFG